MSIQSPERDGSNSRYRENRERNRLRKNGETELRFRQCEFEIPTSHWGRDAHLAAIATEPQVIFCNLQYGPLSELVNV